MTFLSDTKSNLVITDLSQVVIEGNLFLCIILELRKCFVCQCFKVFGECSQPSFARLDRVWNSAKYNFFLLAGSNRSRRDLLHAAYVSLASAESCLKAVCALPVNRTRIHSNLASLSHLFTSATLSKWSIQSSQLPSPEKGSGVRTGLALIIQLNCSYSASGRTHQCWLRQCNSDC